MECLCTIPSEQGWSDTCVPGRNKGAGRVWLVQNRDLGFSCFVFLLFFPLRGVGYTWRLSNQAGQKCSCELALEMHREPVICCFFPLADVVVLVLIHIIGNIFQKLEHSSQVTLATYPP